MSAFLVDDDVFLFYFPVSKGISKGDCPKLGIWVSQVGGGYEVVL